MYVVGDKGTGSIKWYQGEESGMTKASLTGMQAKWSPIEDSSKAGEFKQKDSKTSCLLWKHESTAESKGLRAAVCKKILHIHSEKTLWWNIFENHNQSFQRILFFKKTGKKVKFWDHATESPFRDCQNLWIIPFLKPKGRKARAHYKSLFHENSMKMCGKTHELFSWPWKQRFRVLSYVMKFPWNSLPVIFMNHEKFTKPWISIFMGHESLIYFRLIHFMTPERAVTAYHVFNGWWNF